MKSNLILMAGGRRGICPRGDICSGSKDWLHVCMAVMNEPRAVSAEPGTSNSRAADDRWLAGDDECLSAPQYLKDTHVWICKFRLCLNAACEAFSVADDWLTKNLLLSTKTTSEQVLYPYVWNMRAGADTPADSRSVFLDFSNLNNRESRICLSLLCPHLFMFSFCIMCKALWVAL